VNNFFSKSSKFNVSQRIDGRISYNFIAETIQIETRQTATFKILFRIDSKILENIGLKERSIV
jgi:hypothetical protein